MGPGAGVGVLAREFKTPPLDPIKTPPQKSRSNPTGGGILGSPFRLVILPPSPASIQAHHEACMASRGRDDKLRASYRRSAAADTEVIFSMLIVLIAF